MTLRLDLQTVLRDANRRDDLREHELLVHIKKSLCEFDQRPKPQPVSAGQSLDYLENTLYGVGGKRISRLSKGRKNGRHRTI